MLASIFSLNVIQTALELGCIYALVALALFLSYSILNIADLSTDGCFTLGCAVACQVALTGHPFLALLAAMAALFGIAVFIGDKSAAFTPILSIAPIGGWNLLGLLAYGMFLLLPTALHIKEAIQWHISRSKI